MNHRLSMNNICSYIMYIVILFTILRLQHCLTACYRTKLTIILTIPDNNLYIQMSQITEVMEATKSWRGYLGRIICYAKLYMLATECCIRVNNCYLDVLSLHF